MNRVRWFNLAIWTGVLVLGFSFWYAVIYMIISFTGR